MCVVYMYGVVECVFFTEESDGEGEMVVIRKVGGGGGGGETGGRDEGMGKLKKKMKELSAAHDVVVRNRLLSDTSFFPFPSPLCWCIHYLHDIGFVSTFFTPHTPFVDITVLSVCISSYSPLL